MRIAEDEREFKKGRSINLRWAHDQAVVKSFSVSNGQPPPLAQQPRQRLREAEAIELSSGAWAKLRDAIDHAGLARLCGDSCVMMGREEAARAALRGKTKNHLLAKAHAKPAMSPGCADTEVLRGRAAAEIEVISGKSLNLRAAKDQAVLARVNARNSQGTPNYWMTVPSVGIAGCQLEAARVGRTRATPAESSGRSGFEVGERK